MLVDTYSTLAFSSEPVGIDIAINPGNDHLFISDDTQGKKVYEIDLGPDGEFRTPDDLISWFSVSAFGNNDPEGLTYGLSNLYIVDGAGAEVYQVGPGPDGIFNGVAPAGDDQVTHFDTAALGHKDPEGIEFNPDSGTLYLVSNDKKADIAEVTTSGVLVRVIDISFLNPVAPSDITRAPGSQNPGVMNLYITDRGVDNRQDPNENDGKIYELALGQIANLLSNGGFESDVNGDGKPDSWSANSHFSHSSAIVRSGAYAGRHFATDNTGYTISQTVAGLAAGSAYTFSGWVHIPATADTFSLKLQIRWQDSGGTTISTKTVKTYTAPTGGWTQATYSELAPSGTASAQVRMVISSLNAIIYVDDFEFGP